MPALSCRAAGESRFSGFAQRRICRLLVFGGEPVFGSRGAVFGSRGAVFGSRGAVFARCLAPSSPPEPTLGNGSLPETQQLKGEQGLVKAGRSEIISYKYVKSNTAPNVSLQIWLQAPVILPAI